MALSEEKIAGYRNFTNKLWNIARFVFMSVDKVEKIDLRPEPKTTADAWVLGEYATLVEKVTGHYERHEFSLLGETLRDFTWGTFADWYIEIAKIQKKRGMEDGTTDRILLYVLEGLLKMWHPFMPFVTEAIYKEFKAGLIIIAPWPLSLPVKKLGDMAKLQEIVVSLRNIRSTYKVEPKQLIRASVKDGLFLEKDADIVKGLARLEELVFDREYTGPATTVVVEGVRISVPLEGMVDMDAERVKLQKSIEEATKRAASIEGRLSNKEYVANAPKAVVEQTRTQLQEAKDQVIALNKELERLKV
jgi:valyl-tRNA synthetase